MYVGKKRKSVLCKDLDYLYMFDKKNPYINFSLASQTMPYYKTKLITNTCVSF